MHLKIVDLGCNTMYTFLGPVARADQDGKLIQITRRGPGAQL